MESGSSGASNYFYWHVELQCVICVRFSKPCRALIWGSCGTHYNYDVLFQLNFYLKWLITLSENDFDLRF